MIQNLTSEEIAYLKSLDSKKKRRKFMLDCLVEIVISESTKIDTSKISDSLGYLLPKKNKEFLEFANSDTTAPRIFQGLFGNEDFDFNKGYAEAIDKVIPKDGLLKFDALEDEKCDFCRMYNKIEGSNKCESCHSVAKHVLENDPIFKKYRSYESANSEKKYTEEDMRKCFFKGIDFFDKNSQITQIDFDLYLKSLKNH